MSMDSIAGIAMRVQDLRSRIFMFQNVRPPVADVGVEQVKPEAAATFASAMQNAQAGQQAASAGAINAGLSTQLMAAAANPANAVPAPALAASALSAPAVPAPADSNWPNVAPAVAKWFDAFSAAGARHGVDPKLLAAVAQAESGGNVNAKSPAGALGLMQFMPGTARELGVNPLDPHSAIDGAARLLKSHLATFGNTEKALAAYNAGPGAVKKFDGVPPYAETTKYVQRITGLLNGAA